MIQQSDAGPKDKAGGKEKATNLGRWPTSPKKNLAHKNLLQEKNLIGNDPKTQLQYNITNKKGRIHTTYGHYNKQERKRERRDPYHIQLHKL